MRSRILNASILTALLGVAVGAHAQTTAEPGLKQSEVKAVLDKQGYSRVDKIEFNDGLWEAKATSANGERVDLRVEPVSGRVYVEDGKVVSRLSEDEIRASLTAQGFSRIHDLKFKDGLWQAEAENSSGQEVKLRIDPDDGTVVSAQND